MLWGAANGETCLTELSALAANNVSVQRNREAFRNERCDRLRARLLEHSPAFVVMYGLGARGSYERVSGAAFAADGYARLGNTLCALVEHPTARPGKPMRWWIAKGIEIRNKLPIRNG